MRNNLIVISLLSVLPLVGISAQSSQGTTSRVERGEMRVFFGEQTWLGIFPEEISSENVAKFGLREVRGVGISKIEKDSPAEKAGLLPNDVIIAFDDEKVSSIRKLNRLIGEVAPEHQAELTILRNGSEQRISVILGKRNPGFESFGGFQTGSGRIQNLPELRQLPRIEGSPQIFERQLGVPQEFMVQFPNRQIGIGVTPLTKQLAEYFGVADGKGLLINNVGKNSAAEKVGLKAGDIILEIEGKSVANIGEFVRAVNEKPEGEISLTIWRDKQRQTVRVMPEKSKGQQILVEREFERVNR